MASTKNHCSSCGRSGKRDCPTLKGSICAECCGNKRGSDLQCPGECVYFPFGLHSYDQWLKLDGSWLPKALKFILASIGKDRFEENMVWIRHGEEKSQDARDAHTNDAINYSLCIERNEKGQTLADLWEQEGYAGLNNDERVMARHRRHTVATILEVQKIVDHQSTLCVDALEPDPKPFIVFDRGMAQSAVPFGRYISWVTHFPHYSRVTGSGIEVTNMIWSNFKEFLSVSAADEACGCQGFTQKQFLSENFGECCSVIWDMSRASVEEALGSIDVHQCVSTYQIQGTRSEVEAILKAKPDFQLDEQPHAEGDLPDTTRYVWLRVGESRKIERQMPETFRHEEGDVEVGILGSVKLSSDRMSVETFSKQKSKFARKLTKKYFGKLLVLEKEAVIDLAKHALKSAQERWDKLEHGEEIELPPRESDVPPEVEAEVLRLTMTEHYRKFIDMTVPALDGKTPRQASKDPKMRPKLVELMKSHLYGLHKMRVEKSLDMDLDWLLDELKLQELKRRK